LILLLYKHFVSGVCDKYKHIKIMCVVYFFSSVGNPFYLHGERGEGGRLLIIQIIFGLLLWGEGKTKKWFWVKKKKIIISYVIKKNQHHDLKD